MSNNQDYSQDHAACFVELTVTHNPLAYIYKAFTPTITINGQKEQRPWGTYLFRLPPGDHVVSASYPWIIRECGKNSLRFHLVAGETKKVRYYARFIRFLPGAMHITSSSVNNQ